jgi:hypothetical protein
MIGWKEETKGRRTEGIWRMHVPGRGEEKRREGGVPEIVIALVYNGVGEQWSWYLE